MMLSKALRGFLAGACMALSFVVVCGTAQAQQRPAPTQAFWDKLHKTILDGCLDSQKDSGTLELLKPGVLTEICSCTARKASDQLKASKQFETAFKANNGSEMTRLLKSTSVTSKGEPIAASCANEIRLLHGGSASAILVSPAQRTKLTGKGREVFIQSTMNTCRTDLPRRVPDRTVSKEKLDAACTCIAEGMANRMTDSELMSIMEVGKLNPSQLNDRKSVMMECAARLDE